MLCWSLQNLETSYGSYFFYVCFLMICKFCAKNSIFTNKVNKCSHWYHPAVNVEPGDETCVSLHLQPESHEDGEKQTCKGKTKSNTKKSVMNKFWGIAGASFRWKSFEGSQERAFDEEVLRDGRACIPKKNAMQLFNLWRLFCPEMQSCMERNCLCADIPIIFLR